MKKILIKNKENEKKMKKKSSRSSNMKLICSTPTEKIACVIMNIPNEGKRKIREQRNVIRSQW